MNFLRGVGKFVAILFVTLLSIMLSGIDGLGLGLNGFLCFLIWIVLVFGIVKISARWTVIVGFAAFTIITFTSKGTDKLAAMLETESGIQTLAIIICGIGFMFYLNHRTNVEADIRKNKKSGKRCCPHCASTRIHYVQGHTETYSQLEDENYNGDWYTVNKIKTKKHNGYWQCEKCNRTFTRI